MSQDWYCDLCDAYARVAYTTVSVFPDGVRLGVVCVECNDELSNAEQQNGARLEDAPDEEELPF
jgi:hypothetical protein